MLETAAVVEPCLAVARWRDHAPWPLATGDDRQTLPPDGFPANETPAIADMPGGGAHELRADLPEDTAACDAGDLVEHFADDALPEKRVPARTGDARALDTVPGAGMAARMSGDAAGR